MARSLHYEISTMRLHDPIAGYIVTEFTDVHWECNGLLTMQRQPKHQLDPLLKDLNQDRVVVLRPVKWSGQPGATLLKLLSRPKTSPVNRPKAPSAGRLATRLVNYRLPVEPSQSGCADARRSSRYPRTGSDVNGAQLATNQVDLVCVVSRGRIQPSFTWLGILELVVTLRTLGYPSVKGKRLALPPDEIVVASRYTRELEAHLATRRAGGSARRKLNGA